MIAMDCMQCIYYTYCYENFWGSKVRVWDCMLDECPYDDEEGLYIYKNK